MKWVLVLALTIIVSTIHSHPLDDHSEETLDLTQYGEKLYGTPSEETGDRLKNWKETDGTNAEEMGEYFEGDILFPSVVGIGNRNGIIGGSYRWPNAVIPIVIEGNFSAKNNRTIKAAFRIYHRKTCIRFITRKDEADYISITNEKTGCWSSVGRTGGRQVINLQTPECFTEIGTVIHELMHAIGFFHEQNRWERDNYISINYDNILNGTENYNFFKANQKTEYGFGVEYDYESVMHYSAYAFSIDNRRPTIVPKRAVRNLGEHNELSRGDITKINAMYKCPVPQKRNISYNGRWFIIQE